ncbi:hypothetical protein NX059_009736 [Plenodomus lindquistii]|nr:hypothetical protein NX059_009736 [Plenodomus lindquistii]
MFIHEPTPLGSSEVDEWRMLVEASDVLKQSVALEGNTFMLSSSFSLISLAQLLLFSEGGKLTGHADDRDAFYRTADINLTSLTLDLQEIFLRTDQQTLAELKMLIMEEPCSLRSIDVYRYDIERLSPFSIYLLYRVVAIDTKWMRNSADLDIELRVKRFRGALKRLGQRWHSGGEFSG